MSVFGFRLCTVDGDLFKLVYLIYTVSWLCLTSHRQRGHVEMRPHLLSLAKDVKLGFYSIPTGNRTTGRCAWLRGSHHTTAAPHQLHYTASNGDIKHLMRNAHNAFDAHILGDKSLEY